MDYGVLTGCDEGQEWLLPWFFELLRHFNPDCPVAFADFGMTKTMRSWCLKRGTLTTVDDILEIADESGIEFQKERWIEQPFTPAGMTLKRRLFFKKPLALLRSPFKRTLWLDLDCQVRANLIPLFSLSLDCGLAAAPTGTSIFAKNISQSKVFLMPKFNSGVLVAEQGSLLLQEWAALTQQPLGFWSEESALAFVAGRTKLAVTKLPTIYNWPVAWGANANALIYHWMGQAAKSQHRKLLT